MKMIIETHEWRPAKPSAQRFVERRAVRGKLLQVTFRQTHVRWQWETLIDVLKGENSTCHWKLAVCTTQKYKRTGAQPTAVRVRRRRVNQPEEWERNNYYKISWERNQTGDALRFWTSWMTDVVDNPKITAFAFVWFDISPTKGKILQWQTIRCPFSSDRCQMICVSGEQLNVVLWILQHCMFPYSHTWFSGDS